MNVTVDGVEPPYTTNINTNTGKPQGGDAYIFVVGFFGIVALLITLTYTSYTCKRSISPPPQPAFTFAAATATAATATTYDDADNHHLITFSRGLDDDVLVTFLMFLYSEATVSHKGEIGSDCSICLADYKPADVVRLLPECGHLFHVNCIDTWLKAHPTCLVRLVGTLPLAVQAS